MSGPVISAYKPRIHTNAIPLATGWNSTNTPTPRLKTPAISRKVLIVEGSFSDRETTILNKPLKIKANPISKMKVAKVTFGCHRRYTPAPISSTPTSSFKYHEDGLVLI